MLSILVTLDFHQHAGRHNRRGRDRPRGFPAYLNQVLSPDCGQATWWHGQFQRPQGASVRANASTRSGLLYLSLHSPNVRPCTPHAYAVLDQFPLRTARFITGRHLPTATHSEHPKTLQSILPRTTGPKPEQLQAHKSLRTQRYWGVYHPAARVYR